MTTLPHSYRAVFSVDTLKTNGIRQSQSVQYLIEPCRVKRCVIGPNGRELRFADRLKGEG